MADNNNNCICNKLLVALFDNALASSTTAFNRIYDTIYISLP